MYGIIYEIKCLVNNKMYIGRTTLPIYKRLNEHWKSRKKDNNNNKELYLEMRRYDKDKFIINQICSCDTKEELNDAEEMYTKQWKQKYGSEMIYNFKDGDSYVMKHSTRQKISNSLKGKPKSYEQKQKQSVKMTGKMVRGNHPMAKRISKFDLNGNLLKTYDCISDAEIETGICRQDIGKCARGKIRRAGKFIWKYHSIL